MNVRTKLTLSFLNARVGQASLFAAAVRSAEAGPAPRGGTFRLAFPASGAVDPRHRSLASTGPRSVGGARRELRAAAAPSRPAAAGRLPAGPRGGRCPSRVSANGRTYTFTIRQGFRFSDGGPLTARNFAAAIGRLRTRRSNHRGGVRAGDGQRAGARANKLVIRLAAPSGDFPARLTMPSSARCRSASDRPRRHRRAVFGRRAVLRRQLRPRPQARRASKPALPGQQAAACGPDRDRATSRPTPVSARSSGARRTVTPSARRGARGYPRAADRKVRRQQVAVPRPAGSNVSWLDLNTERPLFRGNVRLRQAVNFAVDRPAVLRTRAPAAAIRPISWCRQRAGIPQRADLPPQTPESHKGEGARSRHHPKRESRDLRPRPGDRFRWRPTYPGESRQDRDRRRGEIVSGQCVARPGRHEG